MKFVSKESLLQILETMVSRLKGNIDSKVTSVTTQSPAYISVDNTDTNNPVIKLTPDLIEKINKVDTLWNEVFNLVDRKVSISTISGVTPPKAGDAQVTEIIECAEYTGSIIWNPNNNPYTETTDFTATITLTKKSGFTFEGIPANFFTLIGSTTVTNDADSGVITATFPKTGIIVLPKEPTPSVVIDYINERLTNFSGFVGYCYTINGVEYYTEDPGVISIQPSWFGQNITIVKNGNINGEPPHTANSDAQTLSVPARIVAPNGIIGGTDGDITGLSVTGMEYRKSGDSNWISISTASLSNLNPGSYEIRYKSTASKFASPATTVNVTKEVTPPTGGWTLTSKIPLNIVVISGADGTIPLANWIGYDGTQILTDELYDCPSPEEQKVRLYAKYATDADYKEVHFDNFGPGTFNGNSLKEWGYDSGPNAVYVVGSNATGGDVLLKLVKED